MIKFINSFFISMTMMTKEVVRPVLFLDKLKLSFPDITISEPTEEYSYPDNVNPFVADICMVFSGKQELGQYRRAEFRDLRSCGNIEWRIEHSFTGTSYKGKSYFLALECTDGVFRYVKPHEDSSGVFPGIDALTQEIISSKEYQGSRP